MNFHSHDNCRAFINKETTTITLSNSHLPPHSIAHWIIMYERWIVINKIHAHLQKKNALAKISLYRKYTWIQLYKTVPLSQVVISLHAYLSEFLGGIQSHHSSTRGLQSGSGIESFRQLCDAPCRPDQMACSPQSVASCRPRWLSILVSHHRRRSCCPCSQHVSWSLLHCIEHFPCTKEAPICSIFVLINQTKLVYNLVFINRWLVLLLPWNSWMKTHD